MATESINMPLTRSRAQQIRGNNKTGRGALCDISANPQQQPAKKQQTKRQRNAPKTFIVAEDVPECDVMIENIEIEAMELSSTEIGESEGRPEWYSPDPQYVCDYMNDIMACYRRSEVRHSCPLL